MDIKGEIIINNVILIGRSVREIELTHLQGNNTVAKFTIAVDRGMSKDKKQEATVQGQPTADFLNITCWNKTAEFVANHLGKGKLIAVQGQLRTGNYINKEGVKVYTTEILANNIKILEWADKDSFEGVEGFTEVDMGDDSIPF